MVEKDASTQVPNNDVVVVATKMGNVDVSVIRDSEGSFSLLNGGEIKVKSVTAEEIMRCLASYIETIIPTAPATFCSVRRMKTPEGTGPFSGEQIARRMMSICGCSGRYNCDCVSVNNQARRELWTEHNEARLHPKAQ